MQNLLCHTLTPAPMVSTVKADLCCDSEGNLLFSYYVSGDMARLRIPPPESEGQCDGLWEHTCFEAFIGIAGASAYREFNFSPSGQWAAYAFSSYRQPEKMDRMSLAPQITTRLTAGHLNLLALVSKDALPTGAGPTYLQVGLSAIIESSDTLDGSRSYWALQHPTAHPDFHHRDSFTFEIPA